MTDVPIIIVSSSMGNKWH